MKGSSGDDDAVVFDCWTMDDVEDMNDLCDACGKPSSLIFRYEPGTTVATDQGAKKAYADGQADTDGESFVVATDKKDFFKRSSSSSSSSSSGRDKKYDLYFVGRVRAGAAFVAKTNRADEVFGREIYLHVWGSKEEFDAEAYPLQTMAYYASCSEPIRIGDVIGSVVVIGYSSDACSLGFPPPIPSPVLLPSLSSSSIPSFSPDHFLTRIPTGDLCQQCEAPTRLTFLYWGTGSAVATNQTSSSVEGSPPVSVDGGSYLVVTDAPLFFEVLSGPSHATSTRFFEGVVDEGETVVIGAVDSSHDGGMPLTPSRVLHVYAWESRASFDAFERPAQTMTYDASCTNEPVVIGDIVGSIELVGYGSDDCSYDY
ncbi:MAG: hypothetical protein AAFY60_06865 [Myxococcota bacterium]